MHNVGAGFGPIVPASHDESRGTLPRLQASCLIDVDTRLARLTRNACGILGPLSHGIPMGYGFFPGSAAYPSPFQLSTGQYEAAVCPWSSASFAACELSVPLPHVNTSVRSLGISFRASWRLANGI
jgi:hypothetical protein